MRKDCGAFHYPVRRMRGWDGGSTERGPLSTSGLGTVSLTRVTKKPVLASPISTAMCWQCSTSPKVFFFFPKGRVENEMHKKKLLPSRSLFPMRKKTSNCAPFPAKWEKQGSMNWALASSRYRMECPSLPSKGK